MKDYHNKKEELTLISYDCDKKTSSAGRLKRTGKDYTISRLSSSPRKSRAGIAGKSTKVDGWTDGSLRRFKDFVRSIDESNFINGQVSAITLTTGQPPSPATFNKLLTPVLDKLNQTTNGKWVYGIEKTRNQKAPHIHLIAVFPSLYGDKDAENVVKVWFDKALKLALRPSWVNQDSRNAWSPEGWLRYMAKRDSKLSLHNRELSVTKGCLPSVRMWGHGDGWTTSREDIDLTDAAHRVITSIMDTAISIQLYDKGLRDKVLASKQRLKRYGRASIVAPRSFRPSAAADLIIKGLITHPLAIFGHNGLPFTPGNRREYHIHRQLLPVEIARNIEQEERQILLDAISEAYDDEITDMLEDMKEREIEERCRSGEIHQYGVN